MKGRIALFLTGFLQVTLVAMNTWFISHKQVVPMVVTGFGISFVWTLNVKKVAFGDWWDRVIYASGAMTGTLTGYLIATTLCGG
jgi:hypothetical protein